MTGRCKTDPSANWLGAQGATWFNACEIPYTLIAPCFLAALAGYYLVWKYIVGAFNRAPGVA
ncbi:MAG: hypothetical protein ABSC76_17455 [Terracidiphilus sp.]|jgi:hypothetical protein